MACHIEKYDAEFERIAHVLRERLITIENAYTYIYMARKNPGSTMRYLSFDMMQYTARFIIHKKMFKETKSAMGTFGGYISDDISYIIDPYDTRQLSVTIYETSRITYLIASYRDHIECFCAKERDRTQEHIAPYLQPKYLQDLIESMTKLYGPDSRICKALRVIEEMAAFHLVKA
jgi:hypothetical protein